MSDGLPKKKVVVFSPNNYSLHSLCTAELLRRRGISVAGIVLVKMVNWKRLNSELKRDGTRRILKKIWNKLILKGRRLSKTPFETFIDFKRGQQIEESSLTEWTAKYDVPFLRTASLNDDKVLKFLDANSPDLIAFTGGGLIRAPVLQRAGLGIVNCHAGILPRYRGMDVVEWAALENSYDHMGFSTHFMDAGIDTGPILKTRRGSWNEGEDFNQIRLRFEPQMCQLLVETCVELLAGQLKPSPQLVSEGRQYFTLHPQLLEVANERLKQRSRSS